MLYQLFDWLKQTGVKVPGGALFQFITFRVLLAVIMSLVITMLFGRRLINYLRNLQVGESVRELGLEGEQQKKGTPTMGGIIIILAILIPTLLLANLNKAYIRLMIFSTLWMGMIGFIDDYLKLRAKRMAQQQGIQYKKGDKDGLAGWFKVLGQVVLGFVVAATFISTAIPKYGVNLWEITNQLIQSDLKRLFWMGKKNFLWKRENPLPPFHL